MNTEFDIESQKSPEAIERDIDAQRASIGNIVDALESKFTPGQMFDQALGMMQSNGTTFLSNLGTSVRNNPLPAVLTSVGLLWLIMSQNRPPPRPEDRFAPDQDRFGDLADGLADGIDSARGYLHSTTDSLKGSYQAIKGKAASVGDDLNAATDSISHAVHDASDRLMHGRQVMSSQFNHLLKEQPLIVAAAGIALGAMLGAALPTTAAEQRYLGKTSANLTDKVKQQAREGYEAVRDTVTKTTEHTGGETGVAQHSTAETTADLSRGLGTS